MVPFARRLIPFPFPVAMCCAKRKTVYKFRASLQLALLDGSMLVAVSVLAESTLDTPRLHALVLVYGVGGAKLSHAYQRPRASLLVALCDGSMLFAVSALALSTLATLRLHALVLVYGVCGAKLRSAYQNLKASLMVALLDGSMLFAVSALAQSTLATLRLHALAMALVYGVYSAKLCFAYNRLRAFLQAALHTKSLAFDLSFLA